MPRKQYKKRRTYRRRPRRNLRKAQTVSIGRQIPDRVFAKLKYNEVIVTNPAAIVSNYQMRLNSLFDPNLTGTGHQPMTYDQWATFYGRYKVHGCKWHVKVLNPNIPIRTCVVPSNTSTAPVDYSDAAESKYAKTAIVLPSTSGNSCLRTISGYISLKKLYGRKELENKDEAQTSANPTEVAVLNIHSMAMDYATNITNIQYEVSIVYYAEFLDRLNIVGS